MSEEMLATLQRGYDAFNRGDPSAMLKFAGEIATPDVEWGATGAFLGVERVYRGPEALLEWMDLIRSEWAEFEVSLGEILHAGDELLVVAELLRGRGRESGAAVEMHVFSAYWFEQGKLRRRASFTELKDTLEAAGLSD
jgi:ketosteroid isomerase-like protein